MVAVDRRQVRNTFQWSKNPRRIHWNIAKAASFGWLPSPKDAPSRTTHHCRWPAVRGGVAITTTTSATGAWPRCLH